jgi:hypothetical protein|tara:strand:+ start:291 stop:701 length:411 start_codon:yes stop_codon:yes gene_type:complete
MSIKIVVNGMPIESDNPSQLAQFVNSLTSVPKTEINVEAKKVGRPLGVKNKKKVTHIRWTKEEVVYLLNNFNTDTKTLAIDPMLSNHTWHAIQGLKTKIKTGRGISDKIQVMIEEYEKGKEVVDQSVFKYFTNMKK